MSSWDRRSPAQLAAGQRRGVRTQVVDAVAPFSPWWRARLDDLGIAPDSAATPEGLRRLPAAGERDVCPDGDPRGAAALVLQAGEGGYALHADGPRLRKALRRRLVRPGSYQAQVEADTRPSSYVWAGLGLRFPVASTRSDLDLVARAGARLWQVLGLHSSDVVVASLPAGERTALAQALELAALAAGTPALLTGAEGGQLARALALLPASVLVLPAGSAARLLQEVHQAGADLGAVSTVLLAGTPSAGERADVEEVLGRTCRTDPAVLAVHVPDGHRLAWGECREGRAETGLHTYPDLELLDVVDPESAAPAESEGGELVLTQLGLRGTALLRWRTGDLVQAVQTTACPACRRTVPRVSGAAAGALVPELALRSGMRAVDLRAVAAAVAGRPDVQDWRAVVGRSGRDGCEELLVLVAQRDGSDAADVAVGVARDVRAVAGLLPTQVVLLPRGGLPAAGRTASGRLLLRH